MAKYTTRQWLVLVVLSLGNISQALVSSILAPFYPAVAEDKGVPPSIYGFIIGIYMLTMFLVSPIYGKYTNKIGLKNLFNIGLFVSAAACIGFSFIIYINNTVVFICISFALRILSAMGNAAFTCGSFTLASKEFPDNVSSVFGLLGTTWGVGAIAGPLLGGALYEVGGFILPFMVNGCIVLLVGIMSIFLIPKYKSEQNDKDTKENLSVYSLFKVPETFTFLSPLIAGAFSIGYFMTALEVHLRQFNLSKLETGGMFMIEGIAYSLCSPLWGIIADKVLPPIIAIQVGAVFMFTSFFIVGPAPFLPVGSNIILVMCGMAFFGIGFGAAFVVGFNGVLQGAHNNGFPKTLATNGLISGVFTSTFSLGCFIGPSIGGYLLDYFGFRWGSLIPLILHLIVINICWIYMCFQYRNKGYIVDR